MAFAGLDENSFAVALTMGFPSAAGQVFTLVNGESRYEPYWNQSRVEQWLTRERLMAVSRG